MEELFRKSHDAGTIRKIEESIQKLSEMQTITEQIRYLSDSCRDIINTERASVFIVDHRFQTGNLYTLHADKMDAIFVPSGKGIIGECITHHQSILVNDVQNDSRFYAEVDDENGNDFITYNLIATPILSEKRILGAIEVLNKKERSFTQDDVQILEYMAAHSSPMLKALIDAGTPNL